MSESRQSLVARARIAVRTEGLRGAAIRFMAATCCSRLTLLERSLEEPLPDLPAGDIELVSLGEPDADEYAALVPGATPERVRKRLTAGEVFSGARVDGRLVGAVWAGSGRVRVPYLRAPLSLADGEALSLELFVAPDMRRRQVASRVGLHGLHRLRDAGFRRVYGVVLPENRGGFAPLEHLGFRRCGRVYAIGVLGLRRTIVVAHRLDAEAAWNDSVVRVGSAPAASNPAGR